jgi:osmotically inducible protein OsmC
MTMTTLDKRLYTAHADANSGRMGAAKNSTGAIDVKLSIPKEMGGPGGEGTTTPEDLFAAGYAACFGGAAEHVARLKKIPNKGVKVHADVTIGTVGQGFGLAVKLTATVIGVTQAQAEEIINMAHQVCPYSNATRNNIQVDLEIKSEA